MKKKILLFLLIVFSCILVGCASNQPEKPGDNPGEKPSDNPGDEKKDDDTVIDDNDDKDITVDEENHSFKLTSQSDGAYTFTCSECKKEEVVTISYESGSTDAYTVTNNTITFNNVSLDSVYSISGTFYGNIVINISDSYELELEFNGFTIYSYTECPIYIESADKVTIASKKNTEDFVYDMREAVSEEEISAAIYALCDLDIQGKGTLNVKSTNNNGIHTKDDLKVKNLTLNVDCMDNALKGNDGVTIQSGTIALIARSGDAIKTTNSSISSKGKQKGTVTINGGDILIYASRDGIDSSYDVVIDETEGSVNLQIFTDKYSKYSSETTITSDSVYYIRSSSTTYKYSILYSDDNGNEKWCSSSTYELSYGDRGRAYYYYPIAKPSGYTKMKVYVYRSSNQEQTADYAYCSDTMTLNESFDTITFSQERFNWTNKTMGQGGMGGMNEGNSDKKDVSTKGIKADNQITINGGNIVINSYDDALHTNNDVTLENNETALGNITINGGTLTFHSNDDGIHADGTLIVNGGTINITYSYEGLEGSFVIINDGNISVVSKDDGINGVSKSGEAIVINGGINYIVAGGDGIDSNSQTSYEGILISGGKTVIISTGQADSSIDTERGYKYTGGYVLAIGRSGGMSNEAKNCQNFNSVATTTTMSLQTNAYLTVSGIVTIKVPTSINAQIICLGKTGVNISASQSSSLSFDKNGVYWE